MLAADEEVDYLEYQLYLRSQVDADLYEILTHLDHNHNPRRAEAVVREISRRQISVGRWYPESENFWRKLLMIVVVIAAVTLALGMTMSREEAIAPQPPPTLGLYPSGNMVEFIGGDGGSSTDGMTVSILGVYAAQVAQNELREAVYVFSRVGGYLLLLSITLWKLLDISRMRKDLNPLRREIKTIAVIALTLQLLVLITSTRTHLPLLINNGHAVSGGSLAKAVTILAPWG